jgi:hypothetical protein
MNEQFDLEMNNKIFRGDFTNTCENCRFNQRKNNNILTCTCANNSKPSRLNTTSLRLTDRDLTNLPKRYIQNRSGTLTMSTIV